MKGGVIVAFCHRADSIAPQFRRSLQMLSQRDARGPQKIIGEIDKESSANISSARCEIVRQFLAHSAKPEWLWMVDSDMTFGVDILDRLLATADVTERPIVGGLCFGVRPMKVDGVERLNDCLASPIELYPTIYTLDEQGQMLHWNGYPPDSVVQVSSTGAACLLVHRSVLADERWTADGHPLPWFRESVLNGKVCSEDHFFCIRAGAFGYPVHLDTSAKTGHVKTFVADEDMFLAQRAAFIPVAPAANVPVDVIVPVLHRPQNVAPLMESLKATAPTATAWFVVEPGDAEEITQVLLHGGEVIEHPGTFSKKVNAAYRRTVAPWLFLCGDDVVFHPGWLDEAIAVGADVTGTNDLCNPNVMNGSHAVHMLIRRSYVDEQGASWDGPGVVCHEGYRHWFVDNELMAVARQRDAYRPCLRSKVEHMHPHFGKGQMDAVYELGAKHRDADERLFSQRLAKFGALATSARGA